MRGLARPARLALNLTSGRENLTPILARKARDLARARVIVEIRREETNGRITVRYTLEIPRAGRTEISE